MLDIMRIVQARISFTIINKDLMPYLMDLIVSGGSSEGSVKSSERSRKVANMLLKVIGDIFPAVYRAHLNVFIDMLSNPDEHIGEIT